MIEPTQCPLCERPPTVSERANCSHCDCDSGTIWTVSCFSGHYPGDVSAKYVFSSLRSAGPTREAAIELWNECLAGLSGGHNGADGYKRGDQRERKEDLEEKN